MIPVLLGLHAVLAAVVPLTARRLGGRVFAVAAIAPAATVGWLVLQAPEVLDGGTVASSAGWVADLGLRVDFRLDGLGLLMAGLISGVGVLVFGYSRWYFEVDRDDLGRFAGTLLAFSGSMLGVVLADNLLLLFVFWELTSITSYLLIGFEDHKGTAKASALHALLVTGAGGLAMLAGFVLLGQAAGDLSLAAVLAAPLEGGVVDAALVLVLLGAFTKSAQVPFHGWLPGAMAAPTPVSAYLHSATMVKAGVYLIARFAPTFADASSLWRPVVVTVGIATMLVGGYRALRQHDLKLLLAFGTVSQLGFMVTLVGFGDPDLAFAGAAVILAHGLFKASLFMVVGIIDHHTHTRDLRRLSGLGRALPGLLVISVIAAASMAGVPPMAGFVAKEAAYEALLHEGGALVLLGVLVGAVLTTAYSARFVWGAFATKPSATAATEHAEGEAARPAWAFVAGAGVLSLGTVAFGLLVGAYGDVVASAAGSLHPELAGQRLYLWHGFTAALGLSALTFAAGAALWLARTRVERLQARAPAVPGVVDAYQAALRGTLRGADRVTGFVQNGSLPIYLGVILVTLAALPGAALLGGVPLPDDLVLAESPLQVAVCALVAIAALGCAMAERRFAAVLFLGAVGLGLTVLFLIQGAPDLAMTQLLIETLSLVAFVLVLRHLPSHFAQVEWRVGRAVRGAIAAVVGVMVTAFALIAAGSRTERPISEGMLERALPDGGGRNVVNVILTDFRALDTMGEITVLTVAALGIAALLRARTPADDEEAVGDGG